MGASRLEANYSVDGIETLHETEEAMAKRSGLLAAVALMLSALAACSNPTAPAATQSTIHATQHVAPARSAGVLSGSDT
jgi:hypothetical protein